MKEIKLINEGALKTWSNKAKEDMDQKDQHIHLLTSPKEEEEDLWENYSLFTTGDSGYIIEDSLVGPMVTHIIYDPQGKPTFDRGGPRGTISNVLHNPIGPEDVDYYGMNEESEHIDVQE